MKKYFEEMTDLRGVAILLVLLGHSIIYVPINLMEVSWCKTLYKYIYYFHMPLFFMLAGFCYNCKKSYVVHVFEKVKRIIIPYLVFSIIDLVPRQLLPNLIHGNNSLKDDILNIIFKGGQYWFLYVLFIIFLIYPIIDKIKNKYIILVIAILVMLQFLKVTDMFLLDSIVIYLLYFLLGDLLKNIYSDKFKQIIVKPYIILGVFALFIIVGLVVYNLYNPVIRIIEALIGCIMAYAFVVFIKSNRINKILKDFGNYSLQIYLLNGFMLVPARIIVVRLFNITNPVLVISIIFIFNAFLGLLISKYCIDKVNIFRYLCGIKINKQLKTRNIAVTTE